MDPVTGLSSASLATVAIRGNAERLLWAQYLGPADGGGYRFQSGDGLALILPAWPAGGLPMPVGAWRMVPVAAGVFRQPEGMVPAAAVFRQPEAMVPAVSGGPAPAVGQAGPWQLPPEVLGRWPALSPLAMPTGQGAVAILPGEAVLAARPLEAQGMLNPAAWPFWPLVPNIPLAMRYRQRQPRQGRRNRPAPVLSMQFHLVLPHLGALVVQSPRSWG